MAVDANSAIGQAEKANNKLAEYFSAMNKYVSSGGTLPDFATFVTEFDYSELHRMSTTRSADAASYENGAAIENIQHMVAVDREFTLRTKGKLAYYSDAESDYMKESNFYASQQTYWVNMLNGIKEEGPTN